MLYTTTTTIPNKNLKKFHWIRKTIHKFTIAIPVISFHLSKKTKFFQYSTRLILWHTFVDHFVQKRLSLLHLKIVQLHIKRNLAKKKKMKMVHRSLWQSDIFLWSNSCHDVMNFTSVDSVYLPFHKFISVFFLSHNKIWMYFYANTTHWPNSLRKVVVLKFKQKE